MHREQATECARGCMFTEAHGGAGALIDALRCALKRLEVPGSALKHTKVLGSAWKRTEVSKTTVAYFSSIDGSEHPGTDQTSDGGPKPICILYVGSTRLLGVVAGVDGYCR